MAAKDFDNVREKVISCLSDAQVEKLVAYVQRRAREARLAGTTRAIVDELIILALLHAGLQAQELCTLRIMDTPSHHRKPELHIRNGHGRTSRTIPLPKDTVDAFLRFVRLYRADARPADLLLRSERGTPFGYISLYTKVRHIGQAAGVGRLHPSVLRHTFLVRLYEKEQDLRLVQKQAGHARAKSTARHVRPQRAARSCDACGKPVPAGQGERIDSGQLLCPSCVRDIRNR